MVSVELNANRQKLKWTHGMMMAQAAHAATSVIFKHRELPRVLEYMKGADSGTMRKVCTEVPDEPALAELSKTLQEAGILLHEVELILDAPSFLPVIDSCLTSYILLLAVERTAGKHVDMHCTCSIPAITPSWRFSSGRLYEI